MSSLTRHFPPARWPRHARVCPIRPKRLSATAGPSRPCAEAVPPSVGLLSYSILFSRTVLVFNVPGTILIPLLLATATYRSCSCCSSHAIYPRCQLDYGPSSRKIGYDPFATHLFPLLLRLVTRLLVALSSSSCTYIMYSQQAPHTMHYSYVCHTV